MGYDLNGKRMSENTQPSGRTHWADQPVYDRVYSLSAGLRAHTIKCHIMGIEDSN